MSNLAFTNPGRDLKVETFKTLKLHEAIKKVLINIPYLVLPTIYNLYCVLAFKADIVALTVVYIYKIPYRLAWPAGYSALREQRYLA